jgi:hypothetical protein
VPGGGAVHSIRSGHWLAYSIASSARTLYVNAVKKNNVAAQIWWRTALIGRRVGNPFADAARP